MQKPARATLMTSIAFHATYRLLVAVVLLACVAANAAAQDTTGAGTIAGAVRDADSKPVEGVRVCALGFSSCAVTGPQGAFRIVGLRAGTYQLEIIPLQGLPVVSEPIVVRAGRDGVVEVKLPRETTLQQTVTVTAPAFTAPEEVKSSGFLVQPLDILKSASALQDVSRYLQTLPGVVVGTNDFRNDIIVRGGSPLENLFVVDNVEIPNINAFANFASAGGTIGILDAELIQDVTFLTGGYPAPYINRTSSVLQVTQREGRRDGFRGWTTLGFAGAGAILEGPLGKSKKGSWIVSTRRSFLDLFTDDIGIGGVPVLYTLNGKAVYDLSERDRIWLVNISGIDEIRLGATEDTNPDAQGDDELFNFDIRYNGWRSATGFNWQRLFGARGVGLLGVTHSEAKVGSEVKDLVRDGVPPPGTPIDEVIANSPTVFFEDSREGETTFKYDLTVNVPFFSKVQAGASFKTFRIDYDLAAPFGSDNPYSIDGATDAFDVEARFRAYQTGAYLQATKDVTSRLDVTVGGRVDNYQYLGETRFSPRVGLGFQLTDRLMLNASYGKYYQQPYFLYLSVFPENRSLVPWRAEHFVAGLEWQPARGWRATLEAYRKDYDDYPVALDYPSLSLANIGDTFNVREVLFPLTSRGRGYSQGIEVFVEKKLTDRLYGQGNLAFSRTRHAGLDGVLRPGSFDYPIVLNLVGGYRLSNRWEVSTRASWLSGRPYTPFDALLSSAQRREVYDLSRVNGLRAPDYSRLDVRVDRTFTVGGEPFVLFAGVQNVTNRRNFAGYEWNRRTNAEEFTEQQGLFPILGFEWRF
jgi:TonB dependent receptor/Carboxypeptidase regulatory-like domain/TonB-dependent Receptor Plug Domain